MLSRNLTFDQSMDMAIEMTGYVGREVNPKNQPLADMLTFVSQFDSKKKMKKKPITAWQSMDC